MLLALALLLGLGAGGFRPTEALARQSMSFSPGVRSRPPAARAHPPRRAGRGYGRSVRATRTYRHAPARTARAAARGSGEGEGDAAVAVPGKGFSMENGILTYPAPARFQPQNLRHR